MGNCFLQKSQDETDLKIEHFIIQSVLGVGGFGKVVCAMNAYSKKWYAVKIISKAHILTFNTGISMIHNELKALKRLEKHPFVAGIDFAFQDK